MEEIKDGLRISGKITINRYRAGMVKAVKPYLDVIRTHRIFLNDSSTERVVREHLESRIEANKNIVEDIKRAYFLETAVECHNLIMGGSGYGLDIIIQRLVGINTYSLNIMYGEIGTGSATPALTDTALATPTNRAAVGFLQDYGSTDAIFQFFFSDSQLANTTYNEFGTFVDGTTSIGSGQLFNHALLSPAYVKSAGTDTTIEVDIAIANS